MMKRSNSGLSDRGTPKKTKCSPREFCASSFLEGLQNDVLLEIKMLKELRTSKGNEVFNANKRNNDQEDIAGDTNKEKGKLGLHKAFVTHPDSSYLYLELDNGESGCVHISELHDIFKSSTPLLEYHMGQEVKVRVLRRERDPETGIFCNECTMKPSRLNDHLKDLQEPSKKANTANTAIDDDLRNMNIGILNMDDPDCIRAGAQVVGRLSTLRADLGLTLDLPFKYKATVRWPDVSDNYVHVSEWMAMHEEKFFKCHILEVNRRRKNACLSLRPSRMSKNAGPINDREINSINDLRVNTKVRGFAKNSSRYKLWVGLGRTVEAIVEIMDGTPARYTQPGNVVELVITKIDLASNTVSANLVLNDDEDITMDPSDFLPGTSLMELGKRRNVNGKMGMDEKRARLQGNTEESLQTVANSERHCYTAPIVDRPKNTLNLPHLNVSGGFVWDPDALTNAEKSDDSSESEDEDQKNLKKKKRKQKLHGEILSEKQLFEKEKSMMDPDRQPESSDDYDRLTLSSPNSSIIWINYMSFHLQSADVDKARFIGKKALATISFREEQEKLNVWVALLNLENLYGSQQTLDEVFHAALQQCEQQKVYDHLVTIYIKTDKLEAAEKLYQTMVTKFSNDKEVLVKFGTFLMQNGKSDKAHQLLERKMKNLPPKEYVNVTSRFAILEFKYGDAERGKTMMDCILDRYQGRIDVWSVYIDMMSKVVGDVEATRRIFERAIVQKLPAKKMKFLYKRYLEFEKQHGTPQTISAVKEKARLYVQANDVDE